jgi:hypothetical protein
VVVIVSMAFMVMLGSGIFGGGCFGAGLRGCLNHFS